MTNRAQRIADALRAYYRSEHSAPITLTHAADLIEQMAAPRAQEPVAWQWLDTANFRKRIPADATPEHWRPLYTAPPADAHEQTAAAMAADNCEMWRNECEALRADAERYRWLRDQHNNSAGLFSVAELGQGDWWTIENVMGTPESDLDAAIDKALADRAEGGAA